jgi:S-layer family protein
MKHNKILAALVATMWLVTLSATAFAEPTILSGDRQTFDKNAAPQILRNITITEDSETVHITAGEVRITLPDSLEMIFDSYRTGLDITLFGTAVDNGKVLEVPEFSFEDGDKTLVIPIDADFELGEEMVISWAYVEGFHDSPSSSDYMYFTINDDTTKYYDTQPLYIENSSITDTQRPDIPTNLVVEDTEDGVKLTWEDPTDLDLDVIKVLRGLNTSPISGTAYIEIGKGIQEFIDTDVEEGETVKYILRSTDGKNDSENSEEIHFVVGTGTTAEEVAVEEEVVEEEVVEEPVDEEVVEEEVVEEPVVEETPFENPFEDIDEHWASAEILKLAEEGIVTGVSEISFNPDGNLNRAEASAVLYRVLGFDEPTEPEENPFSDVSADAWYAGYVSNMKALEMIHGYGDDTYRPGNNISRAEFIKLALEVYYYVTSDEEIRSEIDALMEGETTTMFRDLEEDWYTPYVTTAGEMGFVSGYACDPGRCFGATKSITRAEATVILNNIFIDYLTTEEESV